ncbi:putative gp28-like protein [Esparto virus]|uniref:Putative gp28-like protein n=1 Tax=Esparto virus TaxID=2072209 RepID=A0A2I7G2S8_9VIRU|nr:putative gp28-like protein [Esparto virus]AUQ43936.1 putative gp28-like protein [Esparto virus]
MPVENSNYNNNIQQSQQYMMVDDTLSMGTITPNNFNNLANSPESSHCTDKLAQLMDLNGICRDAIYSNSSNSSPSNLNIDGMVKTTTTTTSTPTTTPTTLLKNSILTNTMTDVELSRPDALQYDYSNFYNIDGLYQQQQHQYNKISNNTIHNNNNNSNNNCNNQNNIYTESLNVNSNNDRINTSSNKSNGKNNNIIDVDTRSIHNAISTTNTTPPQPQPLSSSKTTNTMSHMNTINSTTNTTTTTSSTATINNQNNTILATTTTLLDHKNSNNNNNHHHHHPDNNTTYDEQQISFYDFLEESESGVDHHFGYLDESESNSLGKITNINTPSTSSTIPGSATTISTLTTTIATSTIVNTTKTSEKIMNNNTISAVITAATQETLNTPSILDNINNLCNNNNNNTKAMAITSFNQIDCELQKSNTTADDTLKSLATISKMTADLELKMAAIDDLQKHTNIENQQFSTNQQQFSTNHQQQQPSYMSPQQENIVPNFPNKYNFSHTNNADGIITIAADDDDDDNHNNDDDADAVKNTDGESYKKNIPCSISSETCSNLAINGKTCKCTIITTLNDNFTKTTITTTNTIATIYNSNNIITTNHFHHKQKLLLTKTAATISLASSQIPLPGSPLSPSTPDIHSLKVLQSTPDIHSLKVSQSTPDIHSLKVSQSIDSLPINTSLTSLLPLILPSSELTSSPSSSSAAAAPPTTTTTTGVTAVSLLLPSTLTTSSSMSLSSLSSSSSSSLPLPSLLLSPSSSSSSSSSPPPQLIVSTTPAALLSPPPQEQEQQQQQQAYTYINHDDIVESVKVLPSFSSLPLTQQFILPKKRKPRFDYVNIIITTQQESSLKTCTKIIASTNSSNDNNTSTTTTTSTIASSIIHNANIDNIAITEIESYTSNNNNNNSINSTCLSSDVNVITTNINSTNNNTTIATTTNNNTNIKNNDDDDDRINKHSLLLLPNCTINSDTLYTPDLLINEKILFLANNKTVINKSKSKSSNNTGTNTYIPYNQQNTKNIDIQRKKNKTKHNANNILVQQEKNLVNSINTDNIVKKRKRTHSNNTAATMVAPITSQSLVLNEQSKKLKKYHHQEQQHHNHNNNNNNNINNHHYHHQQHQQDQIHENEKRKLQKSQSMLQNQQEMIKFSPKSTKYPESQIKSLTPPPPPSPPQQQPIQQDMATDASDAFDTDDEIQDRDFVCKKRRNRRKTIDPVISSRGSASRSSSTSSTSSSGSSSSSTSSGSSSSSSSSSSTGSKGSKKSSVKTGENVIVEDSTLNSAQLQQRECRRNRIISETMANNKALNNTLSSSPVISTVVYMSRPPTGDFKRPNAPQPTHLQKIKLVKPKLFSMSEHMTRIGKSKSKKISSIIEPQPFCQVTIGNGKPCDDTEMIYPWKYLKPIGKIVKCINKEEIAAKNNITEILVIPSTSGSILRELSLNHLKLLEFNKTTINNIKLYQSQYHVVYGAVPEPMCEFVQFLLKSNYLTSNKNMYMYDGDLELQAYIYWQLISQDLVDWKNDLSRIPLKKLLEYACTTIADPELYILIARFANFRDPRYISAECLLQIKHRFVDIMASLKKITDVEKYKTAKSAWYTFMNKCNIHHYSCPHTMNEIMNILPMVKLQFSTMLNDANLESAEYETDIKFISHEIESMYSFILNLAPTKGDIRKLQKITGNIFVHMTKLFAYHLIKYGIISNNYKINCQHVQGFSTVYQKLLSLNNSKVVMPVFIKKYVSMRKIIISEIANYNTNNIGFTSTLVKIDNDSLQMLWEMINMMILRCVEPILYNTMDELRTIVVKDLADHMCDMLGDLFNSEEFTSVSNVDAWIRTDDNDIDEYDSDTGEIVKSFANQHDEQLEVHRKNLEENGFKSYEISDDEADDEENADALELDEDYEYNTGKDLNSIINQEVLSSYNCDIHNNFGSTNDRVQQYIESIQNERYIRTYKQPPRTRSKTPTTKSIKSPTSISVRKVNDSTDAIAEHDETGGHTDENSNNTSIDNAELIDVVDIAVTSTMPMTMSTPTIRKTYKRKNTNDTNENMANVSKKKAKSNDSHDNIPIKTAPKLTAIEAISNDSKIYKLTSNICNSRVKCVFCNRRSTNRCVSILGKPKITVTCCTKCLQLLVKDEKLSNHKYDHTAIRTRIVNQYKRPVAFDLNDDFIRDIDFKCDIVRKGYNRAYGGKTITKLAKANAKANSLNEQNKNITTTLANHEQKNVLNNNNDDNSIQNNNNDGNNNNIYNYTNTEYNNNNTKTDGVKNIIDVNDTNNGNDDDDDEEYEYEDDDGCNEDDYEDNDDFDGNAVEISE